MRAIALCVDIVCGSRPESAQIHVGAHYACLIPRARTVDCPVDDDKSQNDRSKAAGVVAAAAAGLASFSSYDANDDNDNNDDDGTLTRGETLYMCVYRTVYT